MADFIKMLKTEINHLKGLLEPLESGKFRLGAYRDGRFAEDHTQTQVDGIKRTISMLQSIVDHDNP